MTTIKALKNFGFDGKHVGAGTILTVDPNDFGGTYQDFIGAGLFEEVVDAPAKRGKKAAATAESTTETTETPAV